MIPGMLRYRLRTASLWVMDFSRTISSDTESLGTFDTVGIGYIRRACDITEGDIVC